MKRFLAGLIFVGFGFALGHLTREAPVNAQSACEKDPTLYSLDFNGDGRVIGTPGDAVSLLTWLFRGGPAPKVCLVQGDLARCQADLEECRAEAAPPACRTPARRCAMGAEQGARVKA